MVVSVDESSVAAARLQDGRRQQTGSESLSLLYSGRVFHGRLILQRSKHVRSPGPLHVFAAFARGELTIVPVFVQLRSSRDQQQRVQVWLLRELPTPHVQRRKDECSGCVLRARISSRDADTRSMPLSRAESQCSTSPICRSVNNQMYAHPENALLE